MIYILIGFKTLKQNWVEDIAKSLENLFSGYYSTPVITVLVPAQSDEPFSNLFPDPT